MSGPIISNTGFWDGKDAHMHHAMSLPLANWIANYLKDEKLNQIIDFGCGVGKYLSHLQKLGFEKLIGYEGSIPSKKEFINIKQQDLTIPFEITEKGTVICLEVAEHIPNIFENIFLDNIIDASDNRLIMSWAIRGQCGDGHINCLNNDEVIEKLIKRGLTFLSDETLNARSVIHPIKDNWIDGDLPHFKNTILIFKKQEL